MPQTGRALCSPGAASARGCRADRQREQPRPGHASCQVPGRPHPSGSAGVVTVSNKAPNLSAGHCLVCISQPRICREGRYNFLAGEGSGTRITATSREAAQWKRPPRAVNTECSAAKGSFAFVAILRFAALHIVSQILSAEGRGGDDVTSRKGPSEADVFGVPVPRGAEAGVARTLRVTVPALG